ncbi:MAG: hypothetical protein WAK29_16705 [Terriglobales bacterium]
MRFVPAGLVLLLTAALFAQSAPQATRQLESVSVPITLDQGRVVIDVDLLLADGTTERIRGWVDNGNPELCMTQRIASLLGLTVSCDQQFCSAMPKSPDFSPQIVIGGMKVALSQAGEQVREIGIPRGASALAPGMSAEINIPSSVLRHYDVLFNFPDRQFSIGRIGSLKFKGVKSKMRVNETDARIQIPGKIENKNYDLGLDLGSSVSFLSDELFAKISKAHPDWPRMTGLVGPFNTGEYLDEPKWKVMRLDRLQYGPLFLTDVAVADLSSGLGADVPAGILPSCMTARWKDGSLVAVLSAEALSNYRIGLDYAHATIYFDIGRTNSFPGFDVVGLILRPEGDTAFTIAGVADFDGKPSVANVRVGDRLIAVDDIPVAESTLGQAWALLESSPGQERKLTIERAGQQFRVAAKGQHFLAPQL